MCKVFASWQHQYNHELLEEESSLTHFNQTWHANSFEQLRISTVTGGLYSLRFNFKHAPLCLHHCSLEANPKSCWLDSLHGKAIWFHVQKCMYCNKTNASNLLFPNPSFKDEKNVHLQKIILFAILTYGKTCKNMLIMQYNHFHTLCAKIYLQQY